MFLPNGANKVLFFCSSLKRTVPIKALPVRRIIQAHSWTITASVCMPPLLPTNALQGTSEIVKQMEISLLEAPFCKFEAQLHRSS